MLVARVNLPEGTPEVGIEIRVLDGVPVLFTTRGEYISGQRGVVIRVQMRDVVCVDADLLASSPKTNEPRGLP